jgi:uncharacterized protein (TIGR02270 family)
MDTSHILWDVVEEHLDEAEFLFEMCERALDASDHTQKNLERSFGERLAAHLDGVVIAGNAVVARVLVPVLENPESERCCAAVCALALLEVSGEERASWVFDALANAPDGSSVRAGIARALETSANPGLNHELLRAVTQGGHENVAELWAALAARRVDVGASVTHGLRADNVAVRTAAVRAAAMRPPEHLWDFVARSLDAQNENERMAAMETAMIWGFRAGWDCCVLQAQHAMPQCLVWVAMLNGDKSLQTLLAAVERKDTRYAALRALGYTGMVSAADICLEWMHNTDKRTAKLAAEAFGTITGTDAYTPGFGLAESEDEPLPDLENDLAENSLVASSDDNLPMPDAGAFVRWWNHHRQRFVTHQRYLCGHNFQESLAHKGLAEHPMRRRRWLQQEITIRSRGTITWPEWRVPNSATSGTKQASLEAIDFDRLPAWR